MFKIWCEWDVGQEGLVFPTEELAIDWLSTNESLEECFEDGLTGKEGVNDLIKSGLITIETVTVVDEKGEEV